MYHSQYKRFSRISYQSERENYLKETILQGLNEKMEDLIRKRMRLISFIEYTMRKFIIIERNLRGKIRKQSY